MQKQTSGGQDYLVSPGVLSQETCEFGLAAPTCGQRPWWSRYRASMNRLGQVVLTPFALLILLLAVLGWYEGRTIGGRRMHVHTVRLGEDLRKLAALYYDNPGQWTVIFQANRGRLVGRDGLTGVRLLLIPQLGPRKPHK